MHHPFTVLAPEYAALLAAMRVNPGKVHPLNARAGQILDLARKHGAEWDAVEGITGVPRLWGIASFERESGSDYSRSPAQGDRWDRKSKHVPKGRGPFKSWGEACVDAYRLDHLDQVGRANWTWTRSLYEGELFNGFGPRAHHRRSGYLWAWSNIYDGGKYISDGHWSPGAIDTQCGMVPMMAALLRLDATLALADALPAPVDAAKLPAVHVPDVFSREPPGRGVAALQSALNRFGAKITVDGSYGRETKRAVIAFQQAHGLHPDGIAGPHTWAALDKLTKQEET